MNSSPRVRLPNGTINELRLITKSLLFLALLTGVLYLRVFTAGNVAAFRADGWNQTHILSLTFLVVAMLSLLGTLRWEAVAGVVAAVSGLALGILIYLTADTSPLLTAFLYGSPFVISGSLSVACWWQDHRKGVAIGA